MKRGGRVRVKSRDMSARRIANGTSALSKYLPVNKPNEPTRDSKSAESLEEMIRSIIHDEERLANFIKLCDAQGIDVRPLITSVTPKELESDSAKIEEINEQDENERD